MIPKLIWQTHEWEYEDLPESHKNAANTWKNLNPEWDYRYTSASKRKSIVKDLDIQLHDLFFLEERNGNAYHFKRHQADLFRYLVTYEYGGVYADMDSVCIKPLDYMFQQLESTEYEVLTGTEPNERTNNAMFAAVPKSEIIGNVLTKIKKSKIEQYEQEAKNPSTGIGWSNHVFPDGDFLEMWKAEVEINPKAKALFSAGNHSKDYLIDVSLERPINMPWVRTSSQLVSSNSIDYYGETISYDNLMERLGYSI